MTDLTQIPVPNEGPITDKIKEIYERSFPPEEQIPLPELLASAQMDEAGAGFWGPSCDVGHAGSGPPQGTIRGQSVNSGGRG